MSEVKIQNKRVNSIDQKESASKSMLDYNNASSMQLKLIEGGRGNIKAAVPLLPTHEGIVKVADFGCSYGRNSMFVMRHLLDEIQQHPNYYKNLSNITFYHEDLPDNDFEEVRKCVEDPELGYPYHSLVKQNNIKTKTECIGKTYYEQIVEDESIDIAFCYTSLHWMPEYKANPWGLIYDRQYDDFELTKWFDNLSEKYLKLWLELRHKELKLGGLVSFNIMTETNITSWLNSSWEKVFADRGLNQRDFDKVNLPVYHRSMENLNKLLNKLTDKFKIVRNDAIEDPAPTPRAGIRAAVSNQVVVGLAQYPEDFPSEESRIQLYDEFEHLLFNGGNEDKSIAATFQWVVLQKI